MIGIMFIFWGVFAVYANIALRIARENALAMELNNIRMSIEHYRVINGVLPRDLNTLFNQEFNVIGSQGVIRDNFLKPFRLDKDNNLLDPFSNRYYYNNSKGSVKSQTKRYENW
jgi:hypothetical protein